MRLFLAAVFLVACGDSGNIQPEPKDETTSSGNGGAPTDGGSTANGGAPSTGGADPSGGNATGGSTAADDTQSGTRLKVRARVGADGSRQPIGWYDANLDTVCTWRKASDGTDRCLPDGITANRFLDDACTQPIMVQSACEPLQFAIVSEDPDSCGNRWRVYHAGPAVTPASAYMRSGANCIATAVPAGDLFATNAEMPASMFVAATVEVED